MPVALALSGPTGSGKSALAMQLAARMPVEIISVDSMLVYRGMDIGTAKPDAHDRALVPHHLIDIRDPAQVYSAGEFAQDARALLDAIHARGRTPLLVGGTMLYFRALLEGLAELPRASPQVRAQLDAQAAQLGWPAMHAALAQVDAAAAARIHPNDAQRIQRALEIHRTTGRTATELQHSPRVNATDSAWTFAAFMLLPADRDALHARLATRFDAMMEAGFLAEVERLHMRGDLTAEHPSIRAVGYRQLWEYLQGECTLPAARARAVAATRQLAKRQLTWLRSQPPPPGCCVLEAFDPDVYERFHTAVLQSRT